MAGTTISSTEVDANNSDIATALTQSIAVDGQSTVTANIPMATYKFTGVGAGSAATDSANLGQIQAEGYIWCGTMTGTADAGVLTPSPAITTYAAGQRFAWKASANVNTGAMSIAISGLTTIAAQNDRAALSAGDHAADDIYMGILDTTSTIQIMKFSGASGDVVGPASATDNSLAKFDGTTGKLLKDGAVIGIDVQAYDVDTAKTDVAQTFTAIQNNSAQPAFLAYNSASDANQTGNGTVATIDFDTEVFDQGSNFATDTFTAPVTGKYRVNFNVDMTGLASATTVSLTIVSSNRTYAKRWTGAAGTFSNDCGFTLTSLVDMDASDTVVAKVAVTGVGADTVTINGTASPYTWFSGELVA